MKCINKCRNSFLRVLGMESIAECSTRAMPMTNYNLNIKRSLHFGMNDGKKNPQPQNPQTFPSGKKLLIMLKGPWIKMTFQIMKGKELFKKLLKKYDKDKKTWIKGSFSFSAHPPVSQHRVKDMWVFKNGDGRLNQSTHISFLPRVWWFKGSLWSKWHLSSFAELMFGLSRVSQRANAKVNLL